MGTVIFIAIILSLFIFGLSHRSSNPMIFGRYSISYTFLLSYLFLTAGFLIWMLLHPFPSIIRLVKNLYTLFAFTIIVLVLTELGLRILNPWGIEFFHIMPYHMQGMLDDPQLGYVHPKSISYSLGSIRVKLNSQGLRDEEIPFIKPYGEKRILMLGDSVTFGWGVDQGKTVSDNLELLLKEKTGEDWRAINAGVNGYNSEQEAIYFRTTGSLYNPDIVILIFVNNDVDPILEPNITTWRRYPSLPDSLPELLNRIRQLSFLYQMTRLNLRMNELKSISDEPSITKHPRWDRAEKAILEIAKQCNAINARLIVAHTSKDLDFLSKMKHLDIESISLSKAWQRTPLNLQHVSRIDPHPSAIVHSAFAEDILDALRDRGWIGENMNVEAAK